MDMFLHISLSSKTEEHVDDIAGCLRVTPSICFVPTRDDFMLKAQEPWRAFGEKIDQYPSRTSKALPAVFHMFKARLGDGDADGKGAGSRWACTYAERLQLLAFFFIESASTIDVTDHSWTLYVIVEKPCEAAAADASGSEARADLTTDAKADESGSGQLPSHTVRYERLVAFATVYTFCNGRSKICQVVTMPPFQRQGHGERLLNAIYIQARASNINEVGVEDPAPGFQRLRDVVDAANIVAFSPDLRPHLHRPCHQPSLPALSSARLASIAAELKITKAQVVRIYEAFKLYGTRRDNEEEYKAYRLYVKARLNNHLRPSASAHPITDPVQWKAVLQTEYQKLEADYDALITSLQI